MSIEAIISGEYAVQQGADANAVRRMAGHGRCRSRRGVVTPMPRLMLRKLICRRSKHVVGDSVKEEALRTRQRHRVLLAGPSSIVASQR
jgi:hypothetical protein